MEKIKISYDYNSEPPKDGIGCRDGVSHKGKNFGPGLGGTGEKIDKPYYLLQKGNEPYTKINIDPDSSGPNTINNLDEELDTRLYNKMLETPLTLESIPKYENYTNPKQEVCGAFYLRHDQKSTYEHGGYPEVADIEYNLNGQGGVNIKNSPYLYYITLSTNEEPRSFPILLFYNIGPTKLQFRGNLNEFLSDNTEQNRFIVNNSTYNSALMYASRTKINPNRIFIGEEFKDYDGAAISGGVNGFPDINGHENKGKLIESFISGVKKLSPDYHRNITKEQLRIYKENYYAELGLEEEPSSYKPGYWMNVLMNDYISHEDGPDNYEEDPTILAELDKLNNQYYYFPTYKQYIDSEPDQNDYDAGQKWLEEFDKYTGDNNVGPDLAQAGALRFIPFFLGEHTYTINGQDTCLTLFGFPDEARTRFKMYGNIMSLLSHDFKNLKEIKVIGQFDEMFAGGGMIPEDKMLVLPATIMPDTENRSEPTRLHIEDRGKGVYNGMLANCVILNDVKLPAESIPEYGYKNLFGGSRNDFEKRYSQPDFEIKYEIFSYPINIECSTKNLSGSDIENGLQFNHIENGLGCLTLDESNSGLSSGPSGTGDFTCINYISTSPKRKEEKEPEKEDTKEDIKPAER